MSRMSGFSFSELSWITNWYLRDETLKEATTSLVNYQHTLPLARHWGDGTFSSSDGQRFTVTVPSRSAVALPRYFGFGKGLTMLNWTSDLYAQYGSKPVKTTNREALHTLDAILDNESDLLLVEHTTDTAGFTEILCGLFDLLGLKFSPRLRDISDQRLWRTAGVVVPPVLQPLFKGNLVRSSRILEQWDDLARLAGSLKLGYTSASLIISKLQAFPRKNALASTLQEYGRLVKTAFLLNYLESEQTRRHVGGQLDKGENIHALRDYLFYGRKGQIRLRQAEEQRNQVDCLLLVVNCIVVWNTVYMARSLEELKKEGLFYKEEELAHLSPCRFRHINVYGKYTFDLAALKSLKGFRPLRQSIENEREEWES
jgi:TnpA family transposase